MLVFARRRYLSSHYHPLLPARWLSRGAQQAEGPDFGENGGEDDEDEEDESGEDRGREERKEARAADADLSHLMHGRKNRERRDSVTREILEERRDHQERLRLVRDVPAQLVRSLAKAGLGSKKRRNLVYSNNVSSGSSLAGSHKTLTGAGGFAVHLTSACTAWPVFEHVLPEVAFAGHSNSGKSTLVNAISGLLPRKGPASVSDRAGWTDLICFYQLGKRPPRLILADMPGYGHAVASALEKKHWKAMVRDYVQTRPVLARCCVLVDCTRGLCGQDESFLRFLRAARIDWQVVLTKCDLLSSEELAQCVCVVEEDLVALGLLEPPRAEGAEGLETLAQGRIRPVSASTGAGIQSLWHDLLASAAACTPPTTSVSPTAVREHVRAPAMRQRQADEGRR